MLGNHCRYEPNSRSLYLKQGLKNRKKQLPAQKHYCPMQVAPFVCCTLKSWYPETPPMGDEKNHERKIECDSFEENFLLIRNFALIQVKHLLALASAGWNICTT